MRSVCLSVSGAVAPSAVRGSSRTLSRMSTGLVPLRPLRVKHQGKDHSTLILEHSKNKAMYPLFSIGHSSHPFEAFAGLLHAAGIEVLADVRSQPWSRFHTDYRREVLQEKLHAAGIRYIFMGDALGGRPRDPNLYRDGRVNYAAVVQSPTFIEGLDRLIALTHTHHVAIMCAERHPADCHRSLLIGNALLSRGADVRHLLAEGGEVLQSELETKPQGELFG